MGDARRIRQRILQLFEKASMLPITDVQREKLLHFVIIPFDGKSYIFSLTGFTPNVLGYFQGAPGTIKPNIRLGLRLARLITLKWLGQRPLSEKMYDLPSNGIRGGPTGIEFGAELHDLINDDLKQIYPKLMNFVKITVYDVAPKVLPMFDKSLAEYALETFSRESIKLKTQHHVEELRPDPAEEGSLLLRIKEEPKGEIGAGIVVWSTGLMQNPFVQRLTSQPIPKHASSWNDCKEREFKIKPDPKTGGITTNTHLRVQLCPGPTPTEAPDAGQNILQDIFALGDCAVIENVVHPGTAQVANQKAVWLAKRLNKSDWAQQSF